METPEQLEDVMAQLRKLRDDYRETMKQIDHSILLVGTALQRVANNEMNSKTFDIVMAQDSMCGIARQNTIPWALRQDTKFFKHLTSYTPDKGKRNMVIMGRKTYESIPQQYRP